MAVACSISRRQTRLDSALAESTSYTASQDSKGVNYFRPCMQMRLLKTYPCNPPTHPLTQLHSSPTPVSRHESEHVCVHSLQLTVAFLFRYMRYSSSFSVFVGERSKYTTSKHLPCFVSSLSKTLYQLLNLQSDRVGRNLEQRNEM